MDVDAIPAIVTGGASGLDRAAAEMLARQGARVTIFDVNAEAGVAAAAEIDAAFLTVNVADDSSVADAPRVAMTTAASEQIPRTTTQ